MCLAPLESSKPRCRDALQPRNPSLTQAECKAGLSELLTKEKTQAPGVGGALVRGSVTNRHPTMVAGEPYPPLTSTPQPLSGWDGQRVRQVRR